MYEASLVGVDEQGEPDNTGGATIVLPLGDEGSPLVSVSVDGASWIAGQEPGFASDSFSVDGDRATASLTFVNDSGEEVPGTVEVNCAP